MSPTRGAAARRTCRSNFEYRSASRYPSRFATCRQYPNSASDASAIFRKRFRSFGARLATPSTMLAATENAARRDWLDSSNLSSIGKLLLVSFRISTTRSSARCQAIRFSCLSGIAGRRAILAPVSHLPHLPYQAYPPYPSYQSNFAAMGIRHPVPIARSVTFSPGAACFRLNSADRTRPSTV